MLYCVGSKSLLASASNRLRSSGALLGRSNVAKPSALSSQTSNGVKLAAVIICGSGLTFNTNVTKVAQSVAIVALSTRT